MADGYIKLYRKILENPVVCKDSDHFAVWCYLILSATHKETSALFKGNRITLLPGQLITGRKSISERLSISESKTKRILIELENDQQIDRLRSSQNSLITITNWDKYQVSDQPHGQQADSQYDELSMNKIKNIKKTTNNVTNKNYETNGADTALNRNKEISIDQQSDQRVTSKRPASDQRVTTNKNVKNERMKEDKENIKEKSDFEIAFDDFKAMRKKIKKPLTERAEQMILEKLKTLSANVKAKERYMIESLNQSILNNWQGVFEVKDFVDDSNDDEFEDFEQAYQDYLKKYREEHDGSIFDALNANDFYGRWSHDKQS